jgi:glycosyltransferase involved in cell wall biosynthesis
LFYLRMPEKRKDIFRRGTTQFEQYAVRNFFSSLEALHQSNALPRQAEQDEPRRRTALYVPIAQFNGGNGFVQRVHIDALRKLGYFVVVVASPWFFENQEWFRRHSFIGLMTKYLSDDPVFANTVVLFPRLRDDAVARGFIEKWTSQKWECMSHRVQATFFENVVLETSLLSVVLGALKFDVLLGNYTFCVPFLQRLKRLAGAEAVPLVLETHDFHYIQNRLRRQARLKSTFDAQVDERLHSLDKTSEFDAAEKARALLHIARELQEQYAEVRNARQMILRPYLVAKRSDPADAVDPDKQVDLFSIFGSKAGDVVSASKLHMLQTQNMDSIDVLFYGTSHPANLVSVRTFLETVFRPTLLPANIRLFVAGDICDQLSTNGVASDLVTSGAVVLLGRVDRIETIIAAAKIVALFVSEGTGFPTRVIEVLGSGQAFSVNAQALHELAEDARAYFPVCETAEEMAADILSLLGDRDVRARRGAAGLDFYDEFFSERRYLERFASAIEHDGPIPEYASLRPVHSETRFAEVASTRLDGFFMPVEFGHKYKFDGTSIPPANLIYDWSKTDGNHTWLDGVKGGILVRTEPGRPIQEIKIGASVFSGIFDRKPVISVLVNNRLLFERPFAKQYEEISLPISPGLRPSSGRYLIEIRSSESGRAPDDPRALSLNLSIIEFSGVRSRATADMHPILKGDAVIFGKRGNADVFMLEGFIGNEEQLHSWTTEIAGVVAFQALAPVAALTVKAYALPFLVEADADFSVYVNEQEVFAGRPSAAGEWNLSIDLRDLPSRPDGVYRVAFKISELARAPGDSRELGWCLKRMELEYA